MRGAPLDERLAAALAPYRSAACLLAVSGGPDSTALMHAAAASRGAAPLAVATVDHGLRPDAAAEAEGVARAAASLGLTHRTLTWAGPHPRTGIQEAAREARYRLLAAHAAEIGAGFVLTGHTLDDQAETVLMRLLRGSGPAGLAGMRPTRALAPGIVLARPLLAFAKAELVAWCEARGIAYLHDPSNADERFARARLRRLRPLLEAEGLTAESLARLAARAARDDEALRLTAQEAHARIAPDAATLDGRALAALPEGLALRVLDLALARAGGVPGRLDRQERLLARILAALRGRAALRRTFRGLLVGVGTDGLIRLAPAPPRRGPAPSDLLGKG